MATFDITPAQVQNYLLGMEYPASREEIIDYATRQGADQYTLRVLNNFTAGVYETSYQVNQEVTRLTQEVFTIL